MHQGNITDVRGIRAGHATEPIGRTGCTALVFEGGAVAGVRLPDGTFPGTQALLVGGKLHDPRGGTNTTIGVVATDAALTKTEANRLATVAHDGLAWSIRPVHTGLDGDTLFAVSAGERHTEFNALCAAAVEVVARAVANAVEATCD